MLLKTIPFVLLLGLCKPALTQAQTCKYVKIDSDPFNKKTARTALMAIGPALGGWEVILQQIDAQYHLGVRIVYGGNISSKLVKGKKVLFKLANDNTVELTATVDYDPLPLDFFGKAYTQWIVKEPVSDSDFKKLTESPITAIKVDIDGNEYLLPKISEKQTSKIMMTADCLVKTAPAANAK